MSILKKLVFTGLMLAVCGLAFATMTAPTHHVDDMTVVQLEAVTTPADGDAVSVLVASDAVGARITQGTNGPDRVDSTDSHLIKSWSFNHSCWIPRPAN